MTRAYLEDTDRSGLGRPDAGAAATETIGRNRGADRRARSRPVTRTSPGRRLLPGCAASAPTASSPTAAPRTWTRARRREPSR
jgi:hypothetical protein